MSNPLDPVNLLTLPLPDDIAWGLVILTHFMIAGAGAYVYMRSLGLGRVAGLATAACYMLNGFFIVWMELRFVVACFCWMYWVLLCVDRAAKTLEIRWALAAGALYAFQVVSGNLHHVLNLTLFLGAYAAFRLWTAGSVRRAAGLLALGFAFGVCLSAPQWATTYELASLCERSADKYRFGNFLHPAELLAFVAPNVYGHPVDGNFVGAGLFGRSYLTMNSSYVGGFALPFVLLGAVCTMRRTATFFGTVGVGLVLFLLALGVKPLHEALAKIIAIDSLDHHRLLMLVALCAATLAGFGCDLLATRQPGRSSLLAKAVAGSGIPLAIVAVLVAVLIQMTGGRAPGVMHYFHELGSDWGVAAFAPQIAGSLLLLAGGSLVALLWLRSPRSRVVQVAVVVCLAGELLYFGSRYNPYVSRDRIYPPTPATDFLSSRPGRSRILGVEKPTAHRWKGDVLPPSSGLCYGIADVRGKEGMFPLRTRLLMGSLKRRRDVTFAALVHFSHCDSAIFDLLGARYIVADRELNRPHLRPVFERELRVYENEQCLPRVFSCTQAIVFESDEDLVRHMHQDGFDPRAAVLLDGYPETIVREGTPARVEILEDEPNRIELSVDAPNPCYLVLADTNFPGWRATIGGERVPVQNAFYLLRSICVPAGKHTVVFDYWPPSFQIGLLLSAGSLLTLIIVAPIQWLRRGPRNTQHATRNT